MKFKPVPSQYLIDNRDNDLCAIALLNRWGLRPPHYKECIGVNPETKYFAQIKPALDELRYGAGQLRLGPMHIRIERVLIEHGLDVKPTEPKRAKR